MKYNPLGQTGLLVSELCLGTMTFGGGDGMWKEIGNLRQEQADVLVRTALDAGVNFIDTANVYADGLSEQMTGQALRNLGIARDDVVIATKVLGPMGKGPNACGASRAHILAQARASLKRLQLDHIDLYQIHGVDPLTPIEETMEALDTLVRCGDVRYVGVSNWAAWQIAKALGIAERKNLAPLRSLQAYYTLAGRDLERELAPMLLSEQVGLMVWSPLAGGLLSGKYHRDGTSISGDGRRADFDFPPVNRDRAFDVIDAMRPIATAHGCSVAQIALAWLLHQKVVTSVIVGARRPEQLVDNLGARTITLSAAELDRLDRVSALPPEYPGWMIERQGAYRLGAMAGEKPQSA
ncbi:Putative oxidoreductase yajO [Gluconacetobacter sp. SXCC-1]|uniref:Aldo/keto reductase n=1 Tax=Komagataeibacter rhaeticus TaxID=215221 RepID=A0A181CA27_9PROT|nr:aldo/keto reductase [Komagataeibacter rhaeticus]ATU74343.1 aldo/keto reductase [Komagataeibacter xylinus]EGG77155.1 Putative oxidoreductase yajO [Gluconacetobacter sp. SXCC-1]QIP35222.1 aldo/keto reductase [Komagataeibacter rhaeticus]QOC47785.1 aldo/keto reductase [Komagataeibacter rhaeticus]WPP22850.1 aldo/keto reductase [Komagataeibacter rhaeticus]